MSNTFTAAFAQKQKTSFATTIDASVITTDAPTNTVLIATVGGTDTAGALLTSLTAIPRATVTDTALYLFISKDTGTTKQLVSSVLLEAATVSATTAIDNVVFDTITEEDPIRLENGDQLYIGAGVALASGIVFTAELSEF